MIISQYLLMFVEINNGFLITLLYCARAKKKKKNLKPPGANIC